MHLHALTVRLSYNLNLNDLFSYSHLLWYLVPARLTVSSFSRLYGWFFRPVYLLIFLFNWTSPTSCSIFWMHFLALGVLLIKRLIVSSRSVYPSWQPCWMILLPSFSSVPQITFYNRNFPFSKYRDNFWIGFWFGRTALAIVSALSDNLVG